MEWDGSGKGTNVYGAPDAVSHLVLKTPLGVGIIIPRLEHSGTENQVK